jgi:hypothetical protein
MANYGRNTQAYRRAAATLRNLHLDCWLCQTPIDYTLTWPNPWSFSLDHITPLDAGGSLLNPDNHAAAHLRHNTQRGAAYVNQKRRAGIQPQPPRTHSRTW